MLADPESADPRFRPPPPALTTAQDVTTPFRMLKASRTPSDRRPLLPSLGVRHGGEDRPLRGEASAAPEGVDPLPTHTPRRSTPAVLKGDYQTLDALESIPEHSTFRVIRRKQVSGSLPPP